ncbi:DNA end-binding protein Ku [Symbiobacterium terraclitae]|uniref:Non-homologous end joining protein Ku n=1 Tax=Symbiobacterium terraclitae TaxID=557451 RepID=A0ABS4JMH6_9FIRM|nr:Ku protein [Symbiobacterium terraclitae]MBP2016742.1 DNA end-binding protein Ku [Symbiobacterium terraclitae]
MWKGAISFGLVTIPVKLYAATESRDIRFNLLHEPCRTPIQYRKFCPNCEREVESAEIVKGYEFERGRYVTLTEEDFESIPLAAKKSIEIVGFVRLAEIDPVYYDRTYYLEPAEGGAKAYALLRHAMELTGRVAIARVVIRSRESLAALRVFQGGVIALETMHFPDEVRSVAGLTGIVTPELRPQEIEMATGLIESLATAFQPEQFANQYRDALMELIQAKVAGTPPEVAAPAPDQGRVVDLMEALRASIQAAEGRRGAVPGAPSPAGAPARSEPGAAPPPGGPAGETIPGVPGRVAPASTVPVPGASGPARQGPAEPAPGSARWHASIAPPPGVPSAPAGPSGQPVPAAPQADEAIPGGP